MSWVLWNLALANVQATTRTVAQKHLDFLAQHWQPRWSSVRSPWDGPKIGCS